MDSFQAMVVKKTNDDVKYNVENVTLAHLSDGEVLIKVTYSSVNYKDMLAVQPNSGVVSDYPMIPGIDLSGTVVSSANDQFAEGQEVLITGFGTGVNHTGGFSEYARVPADWIVPLPKGLTLKEAMIFGTAGFTAALSLQALENQGMTPEHHPHILVTGSTGGVGSIAVQILSKMGYPHISALVRKEKQVAVAKSLGATDVIFASELGDGKKPLNKQTYDYVLDTVGGDVVARLIPQIRYGGSMSMCGNAGGLKLSTNVLPFILRGINLLGIDSVNVPITDRPAIWKKLANEWNVAATTVSNDVTLQELTDTIDAVKNGQHLGRTVVDLS
ncbi:YhdH/YhfP family quinone oxidoreductase [Gracilibacillus timonensis]|uniref:YhdH/YhfP family quinone oxidoreductase n=1 Tax=Gracilibacillus timonensis TaxID=1816696 RepID=UPI000827062C|nr:YhdH/YhfP family quinone oxidoreductase [Gracilibacillus timonensis]